MKLAVVSKVQKRLYYRWVLENMGVKFRESKWGFSFNSKDLVTYLLPYKGAHNKHIPNEVKQLDKRLHGLSEPELNQKAIDLSWVLFISYMETVFEHLGFEKVTWNRTVIKDNLEQWLGKDWWNSDRVKVELGANVTTQFRAAFLSIGVITKEELKNKNDNNKGATHGKR